MFALKLVLVDMQVSVNFSCCCMSIVLLVFFLNTRVD